MNRLQKETESGSLIYGRNAVLEALKADTPLNHIMVTSMTGSLGQICAVQKSAESLSR